MLKKLSREWQSDGKAALELAARLRQTARRLLAESTRGEPKPPPCPAEVPLLRYTIFDEYGEHPTCTVEKEQLPWRLAGTGLTLGFLQTPEWTDETFLTVFSDDGDAFSCRFADAEPVQCSRAKLRDHMSLCYRGATLRIELLPAWQEVLSRSQLPRLRLTVSAPVRTTPRAAKASQTPPEPVTVWFEPTAHKPTLTIGTGDEFDLRLYPYFGAGDVYCKLLFDKKSRSYVFLQPSGSFSVQVGERTAAEPHRGGYSGLYKTNRRRTRLQSVAAVGCSEDGDPERVVFDIGKYYHFEAQTEAMPACCVLRNGGDDT